MLGFQINYFARFPLLQADFTKEIRRLRLFLNRAINPSSPERAEKASLL